MRPQQKVKKHYKALENLTGGSSIEEWISEKFDKMYAYFISENGHYLCPSCAHLLSEYNRLDKPIEYHVNYESEELKCFNCFGMIKSKQQFDKEKEVASKYIGTTKVLRGILSDMGFYSTKVLGCWEFSKTLAPNNTLELCVFTEGNFWINEHSNKIYIDNLKTLTKNEFIKDLAEMIDRVMEDEIKGSKNSIRGIK